jgi:hypothetical protein
MIQDNFSAFVAQSQSAVPNPWFTITVFAQVGDTLSSFETKLRAKNSFEALMAAVMRIPHEEHGDIRGVQISEPTTHESGGELAQTR